VEIKSNMLILLVLTMISSSQYFVFAWILCGAWRSWGSSI